MKKVLYINYGTTKACGVYDLGFRHYNAIRDIKEYCMLYSEVNNFAQYMHTVDHHNPDIIVMNYLAGLSTWLQYKPTKCPIICIPHDMRQGNILSFRRDDLFDYYIILDKNSKTDDKVFKTDRPIKESPNEDIYQNFIPKIGSFGFALTHKNFHIIAREVSKDFKFAEINFHMPHAFYDTENQTNQVIEMCKAEISSGIKLNITTDFLSEDEVIKQLHYNDINCLFYDGDRDLGISSSLDFLIAAQKPILITQSPMFRSYSDDLPTFPFVKLDDIWERWEEKQEEVIDIYKNSVNTIKSETKEIFDKILGDQ